MLGDALREWLRAKGIRDDLADPLASYKEAWFRFRWGHREVPLFPLIGVADALQIHDVHHVLTGYDTDLKGELALAAWELGSGGCSWNLFFWIDRLGAMLLGLCLAPVITCGGFRRGLGCTNLHGQPVHELMSKALEDVRTKLQL